MIKIKATYDTPEERNKLLKCLSPITLRVKDKKSKEGQRNRLYIDIRT